MAEEESQTENEQPEFTNLAIRSPYEAVPVDGTVCLYDGEIRLNTKTDSVVGQGKVEYTLKGSPKVRFEITEVEGFIYISDAECTISLQGQREPVTVLISSQENSIRTNRTSCRISGLINQPIQISSPQNTESLSLGRVIFHLLNFPHCHGEDIWQGEKQPNNRNYTQRCGRVRFRFGEWFVTLDEFIESNTKRKEAISTKGNAFTHVGVLERVDKKLFFPEKADAVLEGLHWFFAFVRGAQSGCVLTEGWRHLPAPLWKKWVAYIVDSAHSDRSWFCSIQANKCFQVSEGFQRCWSDPSKRDWLKTAIGLYVASNRNVYGVDICLANSQILLEMLSWVALLEENRLLSEAGFEKLEAADKFRALLFWIGMDAGVPVGFLELSGAMPDKDGPESITSIRNSIIHPTKKNRAKRGQLSNKVLYQAWQLSQWYAELALLKLFDYNGPYENRTEFKFAGECEIVPWAVKNNQ